MRRSLLAAAGLLLAAPLLASVGPAATAQSPQAPKADPAAPITLWAPSHVTAFAFRHRTWTDLGLRVIAHGAPFELWSQRPSYDDQIQTVWHSAAGDVPLPAGSMSDFSGLDRFLKITIDPKKRGEDTLTMTRKGCLNGYSERVDPNADPRSPYPVGCWYNAYSLGSVQGIQAGWATPVLSQSRPLRIGPGEYTVTATIRSRYAEIFGISPDEATRSLALTVTDERGGEAASVGRHRDLARPAAHRPTGPAGRADEGGPQPDLRSLPAWGISLNKKGTYLRFSATVWNAGDSPLVVDGFRRDGEDLMDAYQYFFDAAGNQTGYQPVGSMEWDPRPSHSHWHFEDFARYTLLDADQTQVAKSKKEAFCLANTDSVDLTVPAADWRPENTDLSTSCGDYSSLSIREVLVSGWGDTYSQYRAGQSFPIADLPNGTYYIAVTANPEHKLVESSTDNNQSLREIRISGSPQHRKVTVPQVGIVHEEGYGGQG
ncbi:lysyl oxidase family protein [Nocardioides aquiterrae]|uniref:Lysyl oxidase n=1 Tax=Nocardioides aquiterrae TaxID=203799 RepID=A0ABP4F743_9ACTN